MKHIFFILLFISFFVTDFCAQKKINKETFTYSVKNGTELQIDKYVDKSVKYNGKRPVIIYVHGGGFAFGDKKNALQIQYTKEFTKLGFVSFTMDYRQGLKGIKSPDQSDILKAVSYAVEDLIDVTLYILRNAEKWNIDTDKIIISGGSAGAITCLSTEYEISNKGALSSKLPVNFNYAGLISHCGCIITTQDTLTWNNNICPMFLMHGTLDQAVVFDKKVVSGTLYAGSNYIHQQLEKLNIPHWLYEEVGADHIVAIKPLQHNLEETYTFINKFVLNKSQSVVITKWVDKKPDSMNDMQTVVPLFYKKLDKSDE